MLKISRRRLLKTGALAAPMLLLPRALPDWWVACDKLLGRDVAEAQLAVGPPTFYSPFRPTGVVKQYPQSGSVTLGSAGTFNSLGAYIQQASECGMIHYARGDEAPKTLAAAGFPTITNVPEEPSQRLFTVPHWPLGIIGTGAGDSGCMIYDASSNIMYSMEQLAGNDQVGFVVGSIACEDASFSSGFGHGARPYNQRDGGCGPMTGGVRQWELDQVLATNGTFFPQHALCFTPDPSKLLANNSSSPWPGPVTPKFPGITQDPFFNYSGSAPNAFAIGQFFMLPLTFDLSSLSTLIGKAMAKSLMKFGCYIVDAGSGGHQFYAEALLFAGSVDADTGNNIDQSQPYGTLLPRYSYGPINGIGNGTALALSGFVGNYHGIDLSCQSGNCPYPNEGLSGYDMSTIGAALQPVTAVSQWVDGNGNLFAGDSWDTQNLLSLRPGGGGWTAQSGTVSGQYFTEVRPTGGQSDGALGAFVVPPGNVPFTAQKPLFYNDGTQGGSGAWVAYQTAQVNFWNPVGGRQYTLKAYGQGMTYQLLIYDPTFSTILFSSNVLSPGQSQTFTMPSASAAPQQGSQIQMLQIISISGTGGGNIGASLQA